MKNYRKSGMSLPLPTESLPAVAVIRRLQQAGCAAYLVGGAIRDLLIGRPPGDFDVATSARPDQIESLFPGSDFVGAKFGVSLVKCSGKTVEVATFRIDGQYSDGRRPDGISFADDPQLDARRRDFTINALYLDPIRNDLLDFHGGVDDCRNRILRAVGDPTRRFGEDGLRLMRAARFAAAVGLTIEPKTLAAMRDCRDVIRQISRERIGEELRLILTGDRPDAALEHLRDTGVLDLFLPEVSAMFGVAQPPQFHPEGCVWTHTMLMLAKSANPSLRLAMAILLHDVGKPATASDSDRIRFNGHAQVGAEIADRILQRLRFPQSLANDTCRFIAEHLKFLDAKKMRPSTLKRFLRQPAFDELLELHRLDMIGSNQDMTHWEFCRRMLSELGDAQLHPPPLLDGNDLLALGYREGKDLGRILGALETQQLDGNLSTPDDARNWLRRRFPPS